MPRIAILKPDDVGDLVLSVPAIRQIARAYPDAALFCSPYTKSLAAFVPPGLPLEEIRFPHLDKSGEGLPPPDFPDGFDALVSLRTDPHISPRIRGRVRIPYPLPDEDRETHETMSQIRVVSQVAGRFSRRANSGLGRMVEYGSGTAHLCLLSNRALSICGPGPYRRFAPFGAHNRVLTRDLSCSPGTQFDRCVLNLCVSRECINTIIPAAVFGAIWPRPGAPREEPRGFGNLKLVRGVGHLHCGTA
jgi:hypothetical protein